jgi:carboxyl-terminal processing protease
MVYHALKGMMGVIQKSFNDPYTVAMDPEEFRMLEEQLNSRDFSGIGVFLDLDKKKENALIVVEPIEGSPAEAAGLKSGDIILRINGVSTKGMNIDSASSRIRGPAKTPVLLHIKRGTRVPFDVKIVRDVVHVSSVAQKMIGDVGYVKLRFFGETTGEEFEKALDEVDRKGARAVIIDLRNNGGGYVMAAVQVSSEFLSKDVLITSVVNYRKDSRDIHKAFEPHFKAKPLVLIVNRYSASASEIFAGCIQDHKAGTIVGEKTFGKGSVQTIHRLPGGGAIKLTTAHYLTPSGKDINKVGINPDVAVSMDPSLIDSKRDAQLEKALGALKK